MKYAILIMGLCIAALGCTVTHLVNRPQTPQEPREALASPERPAKAVLAERWPTVHRDSRLERLLDALERVESGRDTQAIGDGGDSVGILQISTIMVRDVNRILRGTAYHNRDRLDREKSRAMARVYFGHYCRGMSWERMAACWVAGPDGYTQMNEPAVKIYIAKVRRVI